MGLNLQNIAFEKSAQKLSQCPAGVRAEVAFAGRSNAGKSSAINAITGRKSLARTSKTPGRTQLLNFFCIDPGRYLVDLPGYGYAKVPEKMKLQWQKDMEQYLSRRDALQGLVLVMDVRHPLTEFDLQMLHWCDTSHMPVHILLTKSDKLKRGPAKAVQHQVEKFLKEQGIPGSVQTFSALKKEGVEVARQVLEGWLDVADDMLGEEE